MASPSHYRREGRNAYYRGGDPEEVCPHKFPNIMSQSRRSSWLEGWAQAKADDDIAAKREDAEAIEEDEKVEEFARLYNLAKERGLIE